MYIIGTIGIVILIIIAMLSLNLNKERNLLSSINNKGSLLNKTVENQLIDMDIRYIILDKIDNRKVNTIYTGITETTGEVAVPKENHQFVLINYRFSKDVVQPSTVQLVMGEKYYNEVENNEYLLSLMGYSSLKNMDKDKLNYYSVFEIETNNTDVNNSNWHIEYNGDKFSLKDKLNFTLNKEELDVSKQWEIEKKILDEYSQKQYTMENPYIILNPYGKAPLTALVIFETNEPEKISVTIKGKTKETTYSYDFEEYETHHEIPVIGMYADYENKITLQSFGIDGKSGKSKTVSIKTEYLPDDIKMAAPEVYNSTHVGSNLFFLTNGRRTVVDVNGDVRWFSQKYLDIATVNHVLDNGHFLFSYDPFTEYAEIVEMDFLGKIYWTYYDGETAHHDLNIAPDGNIAFISSHNQLKVIDRENHSNVKTFDFKVFSEGKEDLEIRNSGELLHLNTVNFHGDDMILSFRNQHMVVRMNYYTEEIKWILSPSEAYYPELADKFLKPTGENFEWFYSQHEPTILTDLDNNPNTIDVLLFDNGDARGFPGDEGLPLEERYSRIVHYRIDEKNNTVEQIFEFGKEYGFELFSSIHSGAKYLEDEESYLAAFDAFAKGDDFDADGYQSQVIQVGKDGSINWRLKMLTGHYLYRCYKDSFSSLYKGISKLYTKRADLFINNNTLSDGGEYEKGNITYNISNLNQKGSYLNISGWAYLDDYPINNYPVFLQLDRSDGNSYRYLLQRVNSIDFKEEFNGIPNPEGEKKYHFKGFALNYMNLNFIEEGEYALSFVFKVKDKYIGQSIQYSLMVSKQSMNIYGLLAEQKLLENYSKNDAGSFKEPHIVLDPYGIAPLTALVQFETENSTQVNVVIHGKDKLSTIEHSFEAYENNHEIPIYGLYPGENNKIDLTIKNKKGESQTNTIHIKTDPLPDNFVQIDIKQKSTDYKEKGLNFITSTLSGMVGFDANGDIRWYTTKPKVFGYLSPVKVLENGNLAIFAGEPVSPYYNSHVMEVNLIGKVVNIYEIPRNSGHHDIIEMENGNLLALTGHTSIGVVEDSLVEFDRATGEIVKSVDFKDVLPLSEYLPSSIYQEENRLTALSNLKANGVEKPTEKQINEETKRVSSHDWIHVNAFSYNPKENTITICSRNLNSIIKFDYKTLELIWILSDPQNSAYVNNPELEKYLLNADDEFIYTYGQHSVNYLNNGNLILFDNRYNDNSLTLTEDESKSYSRIAVFKIDDVAKTVELVWEWGKERGNEIYSGYISNVQALSDDHMLCNFGGIIYDIETKVRTRKVSTVFSGDSETTAAIIELKGEKVIFEAQVVGDGYNNVYRCYRINPY